MIKKRKPENERCMFCNGPQYVTGGFLVCEDWKCREAADAAESDLDEFLESSPGASEISDVFFDNNGDSPAARWWIEMKRPLLLREFYDKRLSGESR